MKKMLMGLLMTALCGCSSVRVERDYQTDYPFTSLKTFAWKHAEQPETGNPRLDNDLYDQRIRNAVNAELSEIGFEIVDQSEADFLVVYYVRYKQRIDGGHFTFGLGMGFGDYRRHGGLGYSPGVSDYEEAHLTIDLIDPQSDKMFWRATGRRSEYEGSTPEESEKIVRSAVERILSGFPPR